MNQTANYGLSQYEAADRVTRATFNSDNSKIDAAIKAAADAAGGGVKLAVGAYEGDGAAARTISVGFTPKAVLVMSDYGASYIAIGMSQSTLGGLAVTGSPSKSTAGVTALEIITGGFRVSYVESGTSYAISNGSGTAYRYLALG